MLDKQRDLHAVSAWACIIVGVMLGKPYAWHDRCIKSRGGALLLNGKIREVLEKEVNRRASQFVLPAGLVIVPIGKRNYCTRVRVDRYCGTSPYCLASETSSK